MTLKDVKQAVNGESDMVDQALCAFPCTGCSSPPFRNDPSRKDRKSVASGFAQPGDSSRLLSFPSIFYRPHTVHQSTSWVCLRFYR